MVQLGEIRRAGVKAFVACLHRARGQSDRDGVPLRDLDLDLLRRTDDHTIFATRLAEADAQHWRGDIRRRRGACARATSSRSKPRPCSATSARPIRRRWARRTGAFANAFGANVKTDFATVGAGSQVIAAIAGNSMDICNVGSSPMVVGFAQGIKMSMVYVEKYITDSECLAVRKDAGINSLKDLKGKKIGMPFNTSVHFAMLAALKTVGLDASDVTLINVKADSILGHLAAQGHRRRIHLASGAGRPACRQRQTAAEDRRPCRERYAGIRRHRRAQRIQGEAPGVGARLSEGIRPPRHACTKSSRRKSSKCSRPISR